MFIYKKYHLTARFHHQPAAIWIFSISDLEYPCMNYDVQFKLNKLIILSVRSDAFCDIISVLNGSLAVDVWSLFGVGDRAWRG